MPTVTEQTGSAPVTSGIALPSFLSDSTLPNVPTVNYNTSTSITAWVIVSDSSPGLFKVPPITIPGPPSRQTWTVIWSFVSDTGRVFDNIQVVMPDRSTLPPGIEIQPPMQGPFPNQRAVEITLDQITRLDSFSYTIQVDNVSHDPAIVVTPEPVTPYL